MRICIVTVYNSENCGSFLQAYAMYTYLKKMGCDVSFFERSVKGTSHSLIELLKAVIKNLIKLKFKNILFTFKRYKDFSEAIKIFPISKDKESILEDIDCFVIGSDTLWDLETEYFKSKDFIYFGEHFKGKNVVTYAPSVANTSLETMKKNGNIKDYLKNINKISVRDKYSYNIIKQFTEKNVEIVCDPTFLLEKEDYNKVKSKSNDSNYILIYMFGKIDDKLKYEIINYAKLNNKLIISFGQARDWCDKSISFNPYDFLAYYSNADYVITNTFHGCIFSLIFNCNFISLAKGKNKVVELLDYFNIGNRNIDDFSLIADILNEEIDYQFINKNIKLLKNKSQQYIDEVLNQKI